MLVHLRRRGILVARLDGLDDPRVMDVDRAMEDPRQPGTRKARLQRREDGLSGDLEESVVAALDQRRVEIAVVDELGLRIEGRPVGWDGRAQHFHVALQATTRREPRRRHLEQLAHLDQLREREVASVGEQA